MPGYVWYPEEAPQLFSCGKKSLLFNTVITDKCVGERKHHVPLDLIAVSLRNLNALLY